MLVQTLKSWRREKVGSLRSYEAALGVFGYRILPVPPIDNLPADVLEKLEEVGQHFISDDETLAAAIYAATSQPVQHEGRAPRIDYKSVDWLEAAE
ncbi:MAG TPA: hypothetical protein VFF84_02375 [Sphingobium sp.]|nr:hypothetical protein [Sphingobium sp.]